MHFVVEEGVVVGDDDEQRDAVVRRPSRSRSRPSGNRRRRRCRSAGGRCRASASAAPTEMPGPPPTPPPPSRAEEIERMAERPDAAVPRQRQMQRARHRVAPTARRSAMREMRDRDGRRRSADRRCAARTPVLARRGLMAARQRLEQSGDGRVRIGRRAARRPAAGPDGPCSSHCADDGRARPG